MRIEFFLFLFLIFLTSCVNEEKQVDVKVINGNANMDISGFEFNPAIIKIKEGATITWINKDAIPHTVTSKIFDSGKMEKNKEWSKKFDQEGEYDYYCDFHPTMKGKIIIEK